MSNPGPRFAGQEGAVSFLNTTTGDAQIPDIPTLSVNITLMMEMTEKQFIGALAKSFREFFNGVEIKVKVEHNDSSQTVDFANALVAKAQGLSNDEFAIQFSVTTPSGGKIRFILRDVHFKDIPFDLASRTDFFESDLDAVCSGFKALAE